MGGRHAEGGRPQAVWALPRHCLSRQCEYGGALCQIKNIPSRTWRKASALPCLPLDFVLSWAGLPGLYWSFLSLEAQKKFQLRSSHVSEVWLWSWWPGGVLKDPQLAINGVEMHFLIKNVGNILQFKSSCELVPAPSHKEPLPNNHFLCLSLSFTDYQSRPGECLWNLPKKNLSLCS